MGTVNVMPKEEGAAAVAAARAGDESAFATLAERYRPELQVHCYRMLGSFEDAEDLVQETFLRAWRRRATFEGRSSFRAWLYGIATNASLDAVAQKRRRATAGSEVLWLQPYPDRLLDAAAPREDEPDAVVVTRETIELAFLVALQHLPPTQRAVLIVRDVLGWSARETAALLETTRRRRQQRPPARPGDAEEAPARAPARVGPTADPSEEERALLQRYMEAAERDDLDGLAETLGEDARFTMPPQPGVWVGRDVLIASWAEGGFGSEAFGRITCLLTRANRQPAVANYLRRPGAPDYRPLALDVLTLADGLVADIVTFPPEVFPAFGLPPSLDDPAAA